MSTPKEIGLLFTPENRDLVRRKLKWQTRRKMNFNDSKRRPYGWPHGEETRYYVKEPVQIVGIYDGVPSSPSPWVELIYLDDGDDPTIQATEITGDDYHKLLARQDWRKPSSSMFMLKSFARTWMLGVRTWREKLGDISAEDAIAEGIELDPSRRNDELFEPISYLCGWRDYLNGGYDLTPVQSYASLWQSIHGEGSWDPDEVVWVVEWKR